MSAQHGQQAAQHAATWRRPGAGGGQRPSRRQHEGQELPAAAAAIAGPGPEVSGTFVAPPSHRQPALYSNPAGRVPAAAPPPHLRRGAGQARHQHYVCAGQRAGQHLSIVVALLAQLQQPAACGQHGVAGHTSASASAASTQGGGLWCTGLSGIAAAAHLLLRTGHARRKQLQRTPNMHACRRMPDPRQLPNRRQAAPSCFRCGSKRPGAPPPPAHLALCFSSPGITPTMPSGPAGGHGSGAGDERCREGGGYRRKRKGGPTQPRRSGRRPSDGPPRAPRLFTMACTARAPRLTSLQGAGERRSGSVASRAAARSGLGPCSPSFPPAALLRT